MSKQTITKEDIVNINLLLAHVNCLSELIHNLPAHRYQFKAYFNDLFTVVKKYEDALKKFTNYTEESIKQQEDIYDHLMEVTYAIREIALGKEKNE